MGCLSVSKNIFFLCDVVLHCHEKLLTEYVLNTSSHTAALADMFLQYHEHMDILTQYNTHRPNSAIHYFFLFTQCFP